MDELIIKYWPWIMIISVILDLGVIYKFVSLISLEYNILTKLFTSRLKRDDRSVTTGIQ